MVDFSYNEFVMKLSRIERSCVQVGARFPLGRGVLRLVETVSARASTNEDLSSLEPRTKLGRKRRAQRTGHGEFLEWSERLAAQVTRRRAAQAYVPADTRYADWRGWLWSNCSTQLRTLPVAVVGQCPPVRLASRRASRLILALRGSSAGYCLSYAPMLLNFLPFGSVPLIVMARDLPSADTTI
jgi:hypothetical protein